MTRRQTDYAGKSPEQMAADALACGFRNVVTCADAAEKRAVVAALGSKRGTELVRVLTLDEYDLYRDVEHLAPQGSGVVMPPDEATRPRRSAMTGVAPKRRKQVADPAYAPKQRSKKQ